MVQYLVYGTVPGICYNTWCTEQYLVFGTVPGVQNSTLCMVYTLCSTVPGGWYTLCAIKYLGDICDSLDCVLRAGQAGACSV